MSAMSSPSFTKKASSRQFVTRMRNACLTPVLFAAEVTVTVTFFSPGVVGLPAMYQDLSARCLSASPAGRFAAFAVGRQPAATLRETLVHTPGSIT